MRLSSNPIVMRHAQTPADAWQQVRDWLTAESAWIPVPGERHDADDVRVITSVPADRVMPMA